jgi:hypothetical protein
MFPLCSLSAETIIGSDHAPLLLSSGDDLKKRIPQFFSEKGWLERPEFEDLVQRKWRELETVGGTFHDPTNAW